MILFSQGPTKHSRIGNSLAWMSRISYWLKWTNIECHFPWSYENYKTYISTSSHWIAYKEKAYSLYESIFDEGLTAANLAKRSRLIEDKFERANNLSAYDWSHLNTSIDGSRCLYLSGKIDLTSDDVLNEINRHELVICHEPFNFVFSHNPDLRGEDYTSLAPCKHLLLQSHKYIQDLSAGMKAAALHIRRGDYQTWRNGSYFFSDELWVEQTSKNSMDGYKTFVFSNDLNAELEEQLNKLGAVISTGTFEQDFVRLMHVDKIVGPPSTFTGLAVSIAKSTLEKHPTLKFLSPKPE